MRTRQNQKKRELHIWQPSLMTMILLTGPTQIKCGMMAMVIGQMTGEYPEMCTRGQFGPPHRKSAQLGLDARKSDVNCRHLALAHRALDGMVCRVAISSQWERQTMIELVEVTCTKCDQPMRLPKHVAALPADERLCADCVRALLLLFVPQTEQAGMTSRPKAAG